jgi:hypothetical protein
MAWKPSFIPFKEYQSSKDKKKDMIEDPNAI